MNLKALAAIALFVGTPVLAESEFDVSAFHVVIQEDVITNSGLSEAMVGTIASFANSLNSSAPKGSYELKISVEWLWSERWEYDLCEYSIELNSSSNAPNQVYFSESYVTEPLMISFKLSNREHWCAKDINQKVKRILKKFRPVF